MSDPTSSADKVPAAALRWLPAVCVILALVWIAAATWLPFARLSYPYELEWLEGLVLDHTARILSGEPIYVAPSADFVPLLYTPLYPWLGAGSATIVGEGLPALRLVSIAAALAVQVMLFAVVRTETRSKAAALIACGVWSGSYFVVDTWWDTARVDSTFLAFVALGLLLLRRRGTATAVLAALAMVLGYLAKQTALPIACAFFVSELIRAPRRGLVFGAAFAVSWLAVVGIGHATTDGWFSFYTWSLPNDHEYELGRLAGIVARDLLPMLPALVLAGWFFVRGLLGGNRRATLALGALWGGLFVAGILSRLHLGGAVNALMPAWLGCCAIVGLAWAGGAGEAARGWSQPAFRLLALLQLAVFAVDFGNAERPVAPSLRSVERWLPSAADRRFGDELVERLRAAEGDVFVPFHPWLARMAGKRGSANAMAVGDVRGASAKELRGPLLTEFQSVPWSRPAALVVRDAHDNWPETLPGFEAPERLVPADDERTFVPRVGLPTRPLRLYQRAR